MATANQNSVIGKDQRRHKARTIVGTSEIKLNFKKLELGVYRQLLS